MADEMDDEEFLKYCYGMTYTERCGFVPAHLSRLARLAGDDFIADRYASMPVQVIGTEKSRIRELVKTAYERLAKEST